MSNGCIKDIAAYEIDLLSEEELTNVICKVFENGWDRYVT